MSELQRVFKSLDSEYIKVSDNNTISFKVQDGPQKEVGVNGCQIDDMIKASRAVLEHFNKQFPCRETSIMITKLDEALLWSIARKDDRMKRGVEGLSKV